MKDLSMVQVEFLDQYFRFRNTIRDYEREIAKYPHGYVSTKTINGKAYYYLQWKENGKVKSSYIKAEDLNYVQTGIHQRKVYEKYVKDLKQGMRELEKVIKRDVIDRYDPEKKGTC